MLSASLVSRWRAPRVKGLRAALVLAKAARFAVLDRAATPPFDTAPHRAKCLAIKKACCFLWRYSPCSQEREGPEKHTRRKEHEHRTVNSRRAEDHRTRTHRSQHKSPHRAARGWQQRRTDRVPRRHEPLSSVQFRQRAVHRTAEARSYPRVWLSCVEAIRPQC